MATKERTPAVPRRRVDTSRKFLDKTVFEIRQRFLEGESKVNLADEYGVSVPTIADAIHGIKTYKDV